MQFYTRHFGRVCGKITDFSCAKKKKCLVFVSCEKNLWLGEKNIIPLPPPQQLNVLSPIF